MCSVCLNMNVCVAASNGDPTLPNSLHYISNQPNSYELALSAVVEIIQVLLLFLIRIMIVSACLLMCLGVATF